MSGEGQRRQPPWRHEGHAPSPQARLLAASPRMGALPAGVWHVSDHAADLLAGIAPVVASAIHADTGAAFRLLSVPDGPILAVEALCKAAQSLMASAWSDPTGWANAQRWRVAPPPVLNGAEGARL